MSTKAQGPRVSPFTFPAQYDLPERPAGGGRAGADAYRQTSFLLADDLAVFQRGMNLELRVVADSRANRYRTAALGALLGLCSRSFIYRADTCLLVSRGSYVSCLPLLRSAADCIGAQQGLAGGDRHEFIDWLASAIRQNREHAALEMQLGRYRSGAMLAADERLGAAYRMLTEFSMTHFGSTVLQVAPESDEQKLSFAFGEGWFHLGWAQLVLGWLLRLTVAQLQVTAGPEGPFAVSEEASAAVGRVSAEIEGVLAGRERCRVEEVGDGRFLIHNFRRQAGSAPRRILL
jgi:hypothetical protein